MALHPCKECGTEISTKAVSCPKCGAVQKTKGMGIGSLFKIGCLAFIIIIAFTTCSTIWAAKRAMNGPLNQSSEPVPQSQPASFSTNSVIDDMVVKQKLKNDIMNKLDISWSWKKIDDGMIMKADFIITNNSDYDIKDVEMRAIHSAESGTVIDSNSRTIYKLFPAGKTVKITDFDMGFIKSQVDTSQCSCVGFTILNKAK